MKSELCLATLIALGATFTMPASAQAPIGDYTNDSTHRAAPDGPTAEFNKLDANMDGYISKQEARKDKALSKAFDTLDTNKDGKLDATEFSQFNSGGSMGSPASKP